MQVGRTGYWRAEVTEADTAHALGNPGIHVLATPRLAEFCERAAREACDGATRRVRADLRHLAATPAGDRVEIRAELIEIRDGRLIFSVSGSDSRREIVSGRIWRMRAA